MIGTEKFDLDHPRLATPIAHLNEYVADLALTPPVQSAEGNDVYGKDVFGIRFNGESQLAREVDGVSRAFWPTDEAAVDTATAGLRDYLLVCANYPDEGRTDALQFFTTFQPGASPWIDDEPELSELRAVANNAVNIDSSAKLKDQELPPQYKGTESAYRMNLYWLTQTMNYPMAVLEINRKMRMSLAQWGVRLGKIPGAEARVIGDTAYSRFTIDPSSPSNTPLVEGVKYFPPNIFHLCEDGLIVPDNNQVQSSVA